jgi:hypothetical protein
MYKIEVQEPNNWHFLKEDGYDIEYIEKKDAEIFIGSVKGCFTYKLEVKNV